MESLTNKTGFINGILHNIFLYFSWDIQQITLNLNSFDFWSYISIIFRAHCSYAICLLTSFLLFVFCLTVLNNWELVTVPRVMAMMPNEIFNNISVMSWWSVLLVDETGIPGRNHRPNTSQWQTLSHKVASSTPRH